MKDKAFDIRIKSYSAASVAIKRNVTDVLEYRTSNKISARRVQPVLQAIKNTISDEVYKNSHFSSL